MAYNLKKEVEKKKDWQAATDYAPAAVRALQSEACCGRWNRRTERL